MSSAEMFRNSPKLSEHDADRQFNERRVALASQLEKFVKSHKRFKGEEVSVTFAHKGVSSLVSIIETPREKLILKIPLSASHAQGEVQFLRVWEQAGISVPHIIEEGELDDHPYVLMEYIDAPILTDAFSSKELSDRGIYREMGKVLARMHAPEARGFGRITDGNPEFTSFSDWLRGPDLTDRIEYVREHKLLGEEHGSVSKALEILESHVSENPTSSYCHDDFGAANIFATTPITVFDPNPRFNIGYLDLARSMVIQLSQDVSPTQLREGYFANDSYDEEVLHAAMLLNAYMKFRYWHKVNKNKQIQRLREYFAGRT